MTENENHTQDRAREDKPLTEQEIQFCDLYVNGGLDYAGKYKECYVRVFGDKKTHYPYMSAYTLVRKPNVAKYIKELMAQDQFEMETAAVKLQVSETLKSVMQETATTDYEDRFGVKLSPAPLRAVSVNAAKALMEIYPIRHKEDNRLRIEGSDGNVIFNVIVPKKDGAQEEQ